MTNREIIQVVIKFHQHGHHSGYDRLLHYAAATKILAMDRRIIFPPSRHSILNLFHRLNNRLSLSVSSRDLERALKHMSFPLLHFLYPEGTLGLIDSTFSLRTTVIASFHQPPSAIYKVRNNHPKRAQRFRRCDLAIALGSGQADALRDAFGIRRIEIVPHGVDTAFFRPASEQAGDVKTVLVVGGWLRDLPLLRATIERVRSAEPETAFLLAMGNIDKSFAEGLNGIKFVSGISDMELVNLYHRASVLLLPLKDSVANNALLEGMACGLPIVATRVGSVGEYAGDAARLVEGGNAKEHADAVIDFLRQPEMAGSYCAAARRRALDFDWTLIGKQVQDVYTSL